MTPQDHVLDAVLRAQGILDQHIESGSRDCRQTLSRLFALFDDEELIAAVSILNLETIAGAMAEAGTVRRPPISPLYNRTSG